MGKYIVVNCPGYTDYNNRPNCIDLRHKSVFCCDSNSCAIKRIIDLCREKSKPEFVLETNNFRSGQYVLAKEILSMFEIKAKEQ